MRFQKHRRSCRCRCRRRCRRCYSCFLSPGCLQHCIAATININFIMTPPTPAPTPPIPAPTSSCIPTVINANITPKCITTTLLSLPTPTQKPPSMLPTFKSQKHHLHLYYNTPKTTNIFTTKSPPPIPSHHRDNQYRQPVSETVTTAANAAAVVSRISLSLSLSLSLCLILKKALKALIPNLAMKTRSTRRSQRERVQIYSNPALQLFKENA